MTTEWKDQIECPVCGAVHQAAGRADPNGSFVMKCGRCEIYFRVFYHTSLSFRTEPERAKPDDTDYFESVCPYCGGTCVADQVPREIGMSAGHFEFKRGMTIDGEYGVTLTTELMGASRGFKCKACGKVAVRVVRKVEGKSATWWEDTSGVKLPDREHETCSYCGVAPATVDGMCGQCRYTLSGGGA